MTPLARRIAGSLLFGFLLIFAFALLVQLTADLVNWLFGMHVEFLFPRGLLHAIFFNYGPLAGEIGGSQQGSLVAWETGTATHPAAEVRASLVAALIFFVVKLRRREGIFDWADEEGRAPGQDD